MEVFEHDFLEELLALKREEAWDTIPSPNEENQFLFPNNAYNNGLDYFDPNSIGFLPNSFCNQQVPQSYNNNYYSSFNEIYSSLLDEFSTPQIVDSSSPPYTTTQLDSSSSLSTPPFLVQDDNNNPLSSMSMEDELQSLELETTCKIEPISHSPEIMPAAVFNMGTCCNLERKNNRPKKPLGQPSKNLMAERRRRKRLNDRLSMLRSIVPKISKMDRTSILGDTIDYMKELLEKIKDLQQEVDLDSTTLGVLKEAKPNEIIMRNSPKFDVERRNVDTRVEICCGTKPGLLLSTVNTLEAFGLEIQQCVISCFNDFTMQASCSEELEHRRILGSGDIKQALFRSAGYGGRCL